MFRRMHYAWVMAATTFLVLLATAGIRATPSILMVPLESEFAWTRAQLSLAVAINIALFGLIGPFAAMLLDRLGIRRLVLSALLALSVAAGITPFITAQWQFVLVWGFLVGAASGMTSLVLAVTVANRWFETRRGVVMGALSAANATGQLLFLPLLATLIGSRGWRSASLAVSAFAAAVFCLAFFTLRNRPADLGLLPFGANPDAPSGPMGKALAPLAALRMALGRREFWLLAGSFFVCGASTNGLIGTHLIPACHDYGIPELRAASLLAMMGIFDIIGTTGSGWLTDRMDARKLLFIYYGLRGLSLLFLPETLAAGEGNGLNWFAVLYGLDWIATVPPTVKLTATAFGKENASVVYGWVGAAHQLGASLAAFGAGTIRTQSGSYQTAFWTAGLLCLLTAGVFLLIRPQQAQPVSAPA